jgi:hypothetical protein
MISGSSIDADSPSNAVSDSRSLAVRTIGGRFLASICSACFITFTDPLSRVIINGLTLDLTLLDGSAMCLTNENNRQLDAKSLMLVPSSHGAASACPTASGEHRRLLCACVMSLAAANALHWRNVAFDFRP